MAWFQDLARNLGTQNAPFGFAPVGSPSQGPVDPAYNAGMDMIGNIGMGMLASGSRNPLQAFGRSYLGAQEQAQQQNKNQYIAAEMMSAAEEKKQKRQQEAELRQKRNDWLKSVSDPNRRAMLEAYPELTDEYIQATDPLFKDPIDPSDRYKVVGNKIYDVVDKTWIEGGSNGWETNLPKGYRLKEDGSGAEAIPGVMVSGTPKPYVPGPGDRTAIRNANEENAMLEQTLVNLDEASNLVGTPDTNWRPAAGQTEADRPILPNSNSGYFSTFRGKIAENVSDAFVPDAMFGSPKQGANTLRLKQIMDAEALASMGKLLKGPTSDRDVRIMLETVNDPDASPKRKQQSIDQVKRLIRAQIGANQDTVEFSTNGPSAGSSQPVGSIDGYSIELVPEE